MLNPFASTDPVTEPARFYGRRGEIQRIYARIAADRPQSVSVVGEPVSGKSSFLNVLAHPASREKHTDQADRLVFGLLQLQERNDWTPESFLGALSGAFHVDRPEFPEVADYDGFREAVETAASEELSLIGFFDDFDVVTRSPEFPLTFFSFMRSLANTYNVAYITTSRRPLQELCHTKQISDSPFFNIFTTLHLGAFTQEEALELIHVPSERAGLPLEPHADFLLEIAGTFPFFLQIACSALFEYLQAEGDLDTFGRGEVAEVFLEEAEPHFRYIWERFDEAQRRVCLQVARGEPLSRRDTVVQRELVQQGYLVREGERSRLFSSLFTEQIELWADMPEPVAEPEITAPIFVDEAVAPEAIVVIDICGSTEIGHRYGAHHLRSLYQELEGIAFEVAAEFSPRYRRSTGDGLLITFREVRDALLASLEIQRRLRAHNLVADHRHRIPVRFSIHYGETLPDEQGRRFGDAVNMAFKVESLAGTDASIPKEEAILVTERVARELASLGLQGVSCESLGTFELDGFTGLHRVYQVERREG